MNEREIFSAALQHSSEQERAAYLEFACGTDHELRQRIEALLAQEADLGSFLADQANFELTQHMPAVTEQPGDTIGPYKLLQQIGEGGMGVVYMAEQTQPVERRVALKIIKPGMDTQQVIARFEAERQALAMMDHPNIAKVLDAGTTETGRPYFVMELVKGMPVTQYCDEQHLTPKERLELFVPICQAVQHAHQKGIIHRDLKPSNILIAQYDNKPVPKIIDFGVAKAISQRLTEQTMFTQYGQIVGTLEYMSPEQARFNQLDVDTRSDIYSLGVLLYELLTGETPFDKKRLRSAAFDELLRIIREEEPPKPSTKLSSSELLANTAVNRKMEPKKLSLLVRGELDWIVMKAMEKDRNRRYDTATSFAVDIQHYLNDEPVTACPPSAAYKFRKFARRNKVVIGTTAAIAASLILGSGVAIWQAYRAIKAEGIAAERLSVVESKNREILKEKQKAIAEAERADREAKKTKVALAITDAVNVFLQKDLLGMADAESQAEADLSPDPNIKLRTVLDRAAAKIETQFKDKPNIEASIHSILGDTYKNLGLYQKSLHHRERAVEICKTLFGLDDEHTIRSLHNLAGAYGGIGLHERAERAYRELLDAERKKFGERHEVTLTTSVGLSVALKHQNRLKEAEELLQKALDMSKVEYGADATTTLLILDRLAQVFFFQNRFEDAERTFRELLATLKRTQSDEHPDTLAAKQGLGMSMLNLGRYAEAETLFKSVVDDLKRTMGVDHPQTLITMNSLGQVLMDGSRRYADAEEIFREALQIARDARGPDDPTAIQSLTNLGVALANQERYFEAEKCWSEALELRRKVSGALNPDTVKVADNLVRLLNLNFENADEWDQDRRERVIHTCRILGEVLVEQNRQQEAEVALRRGLKLISQLDDLESVSQSLQDERQRMEAAFKECSKHKTTSHQQVESN